MEAMEAGRFTGQVDPTGWWAAEKFNGWRAHWDGFGLYTRKGVPYRNGPCWFTEGLPHGVRLDCELWSPPEHGGLAHVQRAARWQVDDTPWRGGRLQLMVFDAPSDRPFEERLGQLAELCEHSRFAQPVVYSRLRDAAHLGSLLRSIEGHGGEGVVITRPGSGYEPTAQGCRSADRLKVKSYVDSEFRVTGHVFEGEGEARILSHLECETPDGRPFKLRDGVSPAMYPPIGALITVRGEGFTKYGCPQFGRLVAVREDDDLLGTEPRVWSPVKA